MNKTVLLTHKNRDEVNQLRLAGYGRAQGFHVHPAGIKWNRSDDQCTVLGVRNQGHLISTMRIELIKNPDVLAQKLECPWSFGAIEFPVVV